MFSDLIGSTALSARMDPEDFREVISAYQKCVADAVQRFGGFVAKYLGGWGAYLLWLVLIYFGWCLSTLAGAYLLWLSPSPARRAQTPQC
jgi:class 3 adenylate cyclase